MLTMKQAEEILRALRQLPPEKVAEVRDFVLFSNERYNDENVVDESDFWTDEDLRDIVTAVWDHADQTLEP